MVRRLCMILIAPLMLAMAACQGLGIEEDRLDTANKQLLAYAGEVAALATLTEDLHERRVIDNNTTLKIADALQRANDILRSATEAVAINGDPSQAENSIEQVQILVGVALDLLVDFGLTEDRASYVREQGRLALIYAH